ncbi:MAG: alpha-amylase family glycosyl hydrolase [Rhizonema sp. NSF051]|nr:alpha-amylase family glycosyl hydrolase [Rhizonema sp. NSF051]
MVRIGKSKGSTPLLLTLRGTPTLYYGDEIGMTDVAIAKELEQDPWGKLQPGLGRDSARTSMQRDSSANSGFSTTDVQPWLPVADNFAEVNAKSDTMPA